MKNVLKTILVFALLIAGPLCFAQDAPAVSDQPASATGTTPGPTENPATEHIPIPKSGDPFFAPIAASGAPQTFHQRFADYTVVTFGPGALLAPLLGSAITMLHSPAGYTGEWREGVEAYDRIYGSSIATRTSEQTARFLTAAVLHEDFRYRPSTSENSLAEIGTRGNGA